MPESGNHQYLSFGDALFLYVEREGIPINVAAVCTFDGEIPLDAARRFVEMKIRLIPRYRQRVVTPPLNLGLPSWEYDPDFHIGNHVREVRLKRGTEAEFKDVAGDILSVNLDRRRPLWDLTLVRGLKGNRTGFVLRIHHCLADGISGVGLLNALLDPSPAVPRLPKRSPRFQVPRPRDSCTLLMDGLLNTCFSAVNRVLTMHSELLGVAQQVASGGKGLRAASGVASGFGADARIPSISDLWHLMPETLRPIERLPFNVVCRGPQRYRWAEIAMPEIKAIKDFFGATVNDVILSLVTATFRRYVELHGTHVQGRLLRIVVPVNVRGTGEVQKLGNQITFLPVAIPLDIRDPQRLVAAVRERMAFLKSIHLAEAVGMAGTLITSVPTTVQALAGPYASLLPVSFCNLICTNVPGPQMPLYLLGHKMLSMYPYVPIGGEMGINCAILSYNGVAYIGFIGDTHAAPDLERLEDCLKDSVEEMRRSITVRAPRPERKVRPRPKPKRKAASVKRHPEKTAQAAATRRGSGLESGPAGAPSQDEIRLGVGA